MRVAYIALAAAIIVCAGIDSAGAAETSSCNANARQICAQAKADCEPRRKPGVNEMSCVYEKARCINEFKCPW
jgi:hypothetical protein